MGSWAVGKVHPVLQNRARPQSRHVQKQYSDYSVMQASHDENGITQLTEYPPTITPFISSRLVHKFTNEYSNVNALSIIDKFM